MKGNYAKVLNKIKISEVMTRNVISAYENTNLEKIEKVFIENQIHHLPIINEYHKLMGVISYSDLLLIKEWGGMTNKSKEIRNKILFNSNLAKDIMKPDPITINSQDYVGFAAEIFMNNDLSCLPVIDSDKKVLGIITTYDLIVLAYTDIRQDIIF
ncbi:MAG TPA: CBS domain-containing protein [Saprospiraceae bacterium]|nr:CBS domain-containing protein [Saprospiraceae bacterium]